MTLYAATITLILVMDPLGNVPIFLSILNRFEPRVQTKIILRETFIAFIILTAFVFCGQYIMHGLQITAPALSIAGGIILFIIAIRMIFPPERGASREEDVEEPLIVPLAIPLTAGPSALAMVLLFTTREPQHISMIFVAVIISCVIFMLLMLASRYLMKLLGKRGLIAIERLMGMILTTISVQMFLGGLVDYLHHPIT